MWKNNNLHANEHIMYILIKYEAIKNNDLRDMLTNSTRKLEQENREKTSNKLKKHIKPIIRVYIIYFDFKIYFYILFKFIL